MSPHRIDAYWCRCACEYWKIFFPFLYSNCDVAMSVHSTAWCLYMVSYWLLFPSLNCNVICLNDTLKNSRMTNVMSFFTFSFSFLLWHSMYMISFPRHNLHFCIPFRAHILITITLHITNTTWFVGVTYAVKLYDTDVGALVWSQVSIQNAPYRILLSSLLFCFLFLVLPYSSIFLNMIRMLISVVHTLNNL